MPTHVPPTRRLLLRCSVWLVWLPRVLSAMGWYVKTETFKASKTFPQIRPHLDAHKRWVDELRQGGTKITSGYRVDQDGKPGGGGLMIFDAPSYADARELVLQDPLVANDCTDWQVNGWIADVGDITLTDGGAWYDKE